jgi:hypothetical protein
MVDNNQLSMKIIKLVCWLAGKRQYQRKSKVVQRKNTLTGREQERSVKPGEEKQAALNSLIKVTYYIRPEQNVELEKIQLAERRKSGKRKDKSILVREAIDLLIRKYAHIKT